MTTTQEIFDLLDLQPGDGRTRAGCVVGGMMINVGILLDERAEPHFMDAMTQRAIDTMETVAAEKGLTVNLPTVRRYCAIAYAWVPGAGLDDDNNPRRELLAIRHSIHGAPTFPGYAAEADAEPAMVEIYWQAETT